MLGHWPSHVGAFWAFAWAGSKAGIAINNAAVATSTLRVRLSLALKVFPPYSKGGMTLLLLFAPRNGGAAAGNLGGPPTGAPRVRRV
jgi:hypothetical protein